MEAFSMTTVSEFSEMMNNTLENGSPKAEEASSSSVAIFGNIQLTFAIIGAALNAFTFLTLFWAQSVSKLMSFLMKHQAFLDFLVCLMGTIILVQPFMWTIGVAGFDTAVCQLWHSQALYWGVFFLAGWNLVILAVERYLCVCKPFVYANMSRKKITIPLAIIYVASVICNLPAYFEARYKNGECESEYYFEGPAVEQFYYFYSLFYFFSFYFLPCAFFFILYGKIISTLRNRQSEQGNLGQSKVIDRAASQLTKSAVVVTVIFIVTIGPDSWLYLLGSLGIAQYEYNSPLQKIMVFLTLLNSCANPVVYFILLPSYRRDVLKLLRLNRDTSKDVSNSNSTATVGTVAE